jgi:hypothetical protein
VIAIKGGTFPGGGSQARRTSVQQNKKVALMADSVGFAQTIGTKAKTFTKKIKIQ